MWPQIFASIPLLVFVTSSPIVIRSGILKDHSQHQNADLYDLSSKIGISNYEGDEGFNKDNERKFVNAADTGRYNEEEGNKKYHLNEGSLLNEKFGQEGGDAFSDVGSKIGHKKGHHKTGFRNSYHKDETGSNSSYFDDGSDEGDEYLHNSRKGQFGDLNSQRNYGTRLDGSQYANDNAKHGGYNNGGSYEKDLGDRRVYNREKYHNDNENRGKANQGNREGEEGRFEQEEYQARPHYHQPRPYYPAQEYYDEPAYRAPSKKTITVYEDPRVYEKDGGYERYRRFPQYEPRYDSGLVQLDVQPPVRYFEQRSAPAYDYYY